MKARAYGEQGGGQEPCRRQLGAPETRRQDLSARSLFLSAGYGIAARRFIFTPECLVYRVSHVLAGSLGQYKRENRLRPCPQGAHRAQRLRGHSYQIAVTWIRRLRRAQVG